MPPVYDLLQPDGFFKIEEEQISQLNARIDAMQTDEQYVRQKTYYSKEREPYTRCSTMPKPR